VHVHFNCFEIEKKLLLKNVGAVNIKLYGVNLGQMALGLIFFHQQNIEISLHNVSNIEISKEIFELEMKVLGLL
jgi:hypothetical protein